MKAKVLKLANELFVNAGGILVFSYTGKGKEGDIVDVDLIDVSVAKGGFKRIAVDQSNPSVSSAGM